MLIMLKGAHWPTKESTQMLASFRLFSVYGKMAWDGPKWGQEELFPNPDLADILGRTDFDFKLFFDFRIPNFWISRFPHFQDLGLAGLDLSGPKNVCLLP